MARLHGKVALITGGGAGIGRATATLFAREETEVSVIAWNRATGQETVALVRSTGGRALLVQTDVTEADRVAAAVRATSERSTRFMCCTTTPAVRPNAIRVLLKPRSKKSGIR